MRPEIDYTRQRTVAELLAEHGDAGGPARRSRRRGEGPDRPAPPPPAPAGPPPYRPHPTQAVRDPGYRGGPPASPRPAAPPARRDRLTEMLADRRPPAPPGPAGYAGPRGGAPNGADRSTPSGPVRVIGPGAQEGAGRGSASGPQRAVPLTSAGGARDGSPALGRAAVRPAPGPAPRDPAPGRAGGAAAWTGSPPGSPNGVPWEPHRAAPQARPRPTVDRPAPVGRPFLPPSPVPVTHRPAGNSPRPQRVPDPGPATGAYDPFEFDDDELDDKDGPETVVGGDRRRPARTPDPFPTLLDGPATALDLGRRPGPGPRDPARPRRGDGPATDFDVTALRRGDGPATDVDVTSFDVTRRPGAWSPTSPAEVSGPRAAVAPAPPPRVRPFVTVVDRPTELTDSRLDELDQLADRTDVAAPPRVTPLAPVRDEPEDDDEYDEFDTADPDGDTRFAPDDGVDAEEDDDGPVDLDDDLFGDEDDDEPAARPAHAWAGVVAQWLAGAVAGAVLWVLFRYLWRELPVVALAAAVLVTAGLVLLVRQLLHNVDRRTTGFAVLVGLLLTASPAVLVLLGR